MKPKTTKKSWGRRNGNTSRTSIGRRADEGCCSDPNCHGHKLDGLFQRIGKRVPILSREQFAAETETPLDELQGYLDVCAVEHSMTRVYEGQEQVGLDPFILYGELDCGKHVRYQLYSFPHTVSEQVM